MSETMRLDAAGVQREEPQPWQPELRLTELPQRGSAIIEGRTVQIRAWEYIMRGVSGFTVPVYLLVRTPPENAP